MIQVLFLRSHILFYLFCYFIFFFTILLFSKQFECSIILNIITIIEEAVKCVYSLSRKRRPKITLSIKPYTGKSQRSIKMHTAF